MFCLLALTTKGCEPTFFVFQGALTSSLKQATPDIGQSMVTHIPLLPGLSEPKPVFETCKDTSYSYFFSFGIQDFNIEFVVFFLNCCSSTVVSILTPPQPPTPPITASHSQTYPLWLCPCVFYTCFLMDLPLFPPLSLSSLPSGYCQFVL